MKRFVHFLLLVALSTPLFADDAVKLQLIIPTENLTKKLTAMKNYLRSWEENPEKISSDLFSKMFGNYFGGITSDSTEFRNFLFFTKNTRVQEIIASYLKTRPEQSNLLEALQHMYSAKPEIPSDNSIPIRYNFENRMYEENIDYFDFAETDFFSGRLGLFLPQNKWTVITKQPGSGASDEKVSTSKQTVYLIVGGPTNSLSITLTKQSGVEPDESLAAIDTASIAKVYGDSVGYWLLPMEGEIARSGTETYSVICGIGPDGPNNMESGTVAAYLYDSGKKEMYSIIYFVNFLPNNLHFGHRKDIYDYLLTMASYGFLK